MEAENMDRALLSSFLNRIEKKEAELLSWGVVDGFIGEEELREMAEDFLLENKVDIDPDDLIEQMRNSALLHVVETSPERRWRSRVSEATRLIYRLKQLFPKQRWETGRSLVSDFRFQITPRKFPRRDIPAETLCGELKDVLSPLQSDTIKTLLSDSDGNPYRISGFQERAVKNALACLKEKKSMGMMVCAGTGAGKTLTYYLPTLVEVVGILEKGPESYWTKSVSLYPRNELLKDQFMEAWRSALRLNTVLDRAGKRPIRLGIFFGDTPYRTGVTDLNIDKWSRVRQGRICPFLHCPTENCTGDLVWTEEDFRLGQERLHCTKCGFISDPRQLPLTRQSMLEKCPDLLFTTTEMLNRQLSNGSYKVVFGVGSQVQSPRIILLDEVHLYNGLHGAQVAYLLRRWRRVARLNAFVTGLSATLEAAEDFFQELTGLNADKIFVIQPREEEYEEFGHEYNLAIQGDPLSGTSLLSCSIQTAMLMGRILDSRSLRTSRGLFGTRGFLFTDDLDVTNRLYKDLRDAEKKQLAKIREPRLESTDRYKRLMGQSWDICKSIRGQNTFYPLEVSRTSSQDPGLEQKSDLVVCTTSLEVGMDDTECGFILQHKAPRDAASFLQRKGRAGRPTAMRPITVIVLTDYGRDRIAFQSYERLFSPTLRRRDLPLRNRHVQKMQAGYAFLEWLSISNGVEFSASGCLDLCQSNLRTLASKPVEKLRMVQKELAQFLGIILSQDEQGQRLRETLRAEIKRTLSLSEDEVDQVLWSSPRSLFLHFLPSLKRRLESGWETYSGEKEFFENDSPMPDFLPRSLFQDLNIPDIQIAPEGQTSEISHNMDLLQGLKSFAPGNVTRRFSINESDPGFWIPPWGESLLDPGDYRLEISTFCAAGDREKLGVFSYFEEGERVDLPVFRPWRLSVKPTKAEVLPDQTKRIILDTSKAMLNWRSQFLPFGEGEEGYPLQEGELGGLIKGIRLYAHCNNEGVEVRRFADSSTVFLKYQEIKGNQRKSRTIKKSCSFRDSKNPAGIGFAQDVDGICFDITVPADFEEKMFKMDERRRRAFRLAFFKYKLKHHPEIDRKANDFQKDWIGQIFLSTLTSQAALSGLPLDGTLFKIQDSLNNSMLETLNLLYPILSEEERLQENEENEPDGIKQDGLEGTVASQNRTLDDLKKLLSDPKIQEVLVDEISPVLWSEPTEEWIPWLRETFLSTISAALLAACLQMSPDLDALDLITDIETKQTNPSLSDTRIWITENASGGVGFIERIWAEHLHDPRKIYLLFQKELRASNLELDDQQLSRFVRLLKGDTELHEVCQLYRERKTLSETTSLVNRLSNILLERGFLPRRSFLTILFSRVLRPGSDSGTDELLEQMINQWEEIERKLDLEIDMRVMAYIISQLEVGKKVEEKIRSIWENDPNLPPPNTYQVIYSLLWPRGWQIRSQGLQTYNPFRSFLPPDRFIMSPWIDMNLESIAIEGDWFNAIEGAFRRGHLVELVCPSEKRDLLKRTIAKLVVTPLDLGGLMVFAYIRSFSRDSENMRVGLEIREVG